MKYYPYIRINGEVLSANFELPSMRVGFSIPINLLTRWEL